MKLKKYKKILLIFSVLSAVVLTAVPGFSVSAGQIIKSSTIVNSDGELNANEWYDPNDSIEIKNNTLMIPNDSTQDTRLISKTIAKSEDGYTDMLKFDCNIRFTQIASDEKFILAFGLSGVEAYNAEPGNVEIEFTNNGGVCAGIAYYDDDGNTNVLTPAKRCGTMKSNIKISVLLTTNKTMTLKVNNLVLATVKLPTSAEGRVGFLQTGNCGAEISDVKADFQYYERPENTNFFEDFESGSYNDNLFTIRFGGASRTPSYIAVEKYKDNNVLMFRNTSLCYLGTKQQYSNFELSFDIPYISRTTTKDENGKVLIPPSNDFGISFGDNAVNFSGYQFTTSTDLILFTPSSTWSYNHEPKKFFVKYADMGFFDRNTDQGFSIKIVVKDGNFTLGLKSLKDKEFTTVANAFYENMRTGFIKIWSTGDANFALDNLRITNLDNNPNTVDTEFKSAILTVSDYDYKTGELKFNPKSDEETAKSDESFNWMSIVLYTAISSVAVLGICTVIAIIKKRKSNKRGSDV